MRNGNVHVGKRTMMFLEYGRGSSGHLKSDSLYPVHVARNWQDQQIRTHLHVYGQD